MKWLSGIAVPAVLLLVAPNAGAAAKPGPFVALRIDHEAETADGESTKAVGEQRGSGVVIAPGPDESWFVLTNAHVVEVDPNVGRAAPYVFAGGRWNRGTIIAENAEADLALIQVSIAETLRTVPISSEPPSDHAKITTHGFSGGKKYRERKSELRYTLPLGDGAFARAADRYFVRTTFNAGESGGAVLIGGQLVGLIHGNDPDAGWGIVVDYPALTTFLKDLLPMGDQLSSEEPTAASEPLPAS